MISLGQLQSLWRGEKNTSKIQDLPADFEGKVADLLKDERAREYEQNIKDIIRQLNRERRNKILRHCMGPHPENPPENLSTREEKLYEQITHTLSCYEKNLLDEQDKTCPQKNETPKHNAVFIREMPKFTAADGSLIGPFKSGERAHLPPKTLEILVKQQVAEKL